MLEAVPEISTLYYCINEKLNDFLLDLDMHLFYGSPHIQERLGHLTFNIGPRSFFQTNTRQGKVLYDVVLQFAGLQGHENVYDLYTGIGSIGLYLAGACRQIVGIEEVAPAIEDAKNNAQLNEITNARFYAGDVKDILTTSFSEQHGRPDLLVTDPPRAGMHPKVVKCYCNLGLLKWFM